MENQIAVIAKDSGLEESKVKSLLVKFNDSFVKARELVEKSQNITVTSEGQVAEMKEARLKRLELKNLRVEVEKTRKQEKDQSLREGQTIDLMARKIKELIEPVEEHLEKQEKFAENLAKERKARLLLERRELVLGTGTNPDLYKLEELTETGFGDLLTDLKSQKLERDRVAREALEAEKRKAEEQAAEQERMRQENAKLRAEAEAREAALQKERQEQEAKLAEERARAEEERKKREAIEQAEAAKKAEEEAAKRQALLAPDKDKLIGLAESLEALPMPNLSDREAGKVLDEVKDYLTRIAKNLRQKAEQL